MELERKFKAKYGEKEYERIFDDDFREAIRNMDKISLVISKDRKENLENSKP